MRVKGGGRPTGLCRLHSHGRLRRSSRRRVQLSTFCSTSANIAKATDLRQEERLSREPDTWRET
eukprot:3939429-Prymnesium_polylepis.1